MQIGVVVRNITQAVDFCSSTFGCGPFKVFVPGIFHTKTYHGRSAQFEMKLAFADWGPIQIELIEPIRGESIYFDFLKRSPNGGLHHLGFEVENLDATIEAYERIGVRVIQDGRAARGGFAYLDTENLIGYVVEIMSGGKACLEDLIEEAKRRRTF